MGRPKASERLTDTQTHDDILRAAENQFALKGYSGASVKAIAAEAGVTGAMIHYYFGNKEKLYHAVLDHIVEELQLMAQKIVETGKPPVQRLETYLNWFFDYAVRHPNLARLTVMGLGNPENDYFHQIIENNIRPLFQMGIGFLEKGIGDKTFRPVDPHHFFLAIYGMIIPIFADQKFFGKLIDKDLLSSEEMQKRRECLLDIAFNALGLKRPKGS